MIEGPEGRGGTRVNRRRQMPASGNILTGDFRRGALDNQKGTRHGNQRRLGAPSAPPPRVSWEAVRDAPHRGPACGRLARFSSQAAAFRRRGLTASDLDRPTASDPAAVRELYRTARSRLKSGPYDLNLTQVTFPAGMPSNASHHRSGAALYYVVSGTGANTVDGKTEAKGPGSLVYEMYGLVHQWGNPGSEPLIFVTFNINHQGVAAVLPGVPARTQ
jgi:quercetin dioxygenase-like cupin family protein